MMDDDELRVSNFTDDDQVELGEALVDHLSALGVEQDIAKPVHQLLATVDQVYGIDPDVIESCADAQVRALTMTIKAIMATPEVNEEEKSAQIRKALYSSVVGQIVYGIEVGSYLARYKVSARRVWKKAE